MKMKLWYQSIIIIIYIYNIKKFEICAVIVIGMVIGESYS